MKKKILSIALVLCMVLTVMPTVAVFATTTTVTVDDLTYTFDSDTSTLTISGTGAMNNYDPVYGQPWADFRSMIKKVVIEDGVTSISYWAFVDYTSLTSVYLSDSVGTIGDNAFEGCNNLMSVRMGGNMTIGQYGLSNCPKLTSLSISGDAYFSNSYALAVNENLINVTIGGDATFGDWSFFCDTNLTSLYICGDLTLLSPSGGDRYGIFSSCPKNITVYSCEGSNVETVLKNAGYTSFTYVSNVTKEFIIDVGTWGKDYTYDIANGVLTVLTPTPLTIRNIDPTTATNHRIVVKNDVDANITLAGVNIENSSASPFEIEANSTGNVTITLADGTTNTLKATHYAYAALQKEGDGEGIGKLTIQGGTLGTGELIAEARNGAGIGGNFGSYNSASVSNITITGGAVTATSTVGAGIGSGYAAAASGSVSNIFIDGGTVTAISTNGVGIGSGKADGVSGAVSNIFITGGSVEASLGCQPTDGKGNNVYLVTIPNPDKKPVIINGKLWTPVNHTAADSTDTYLYAYSTTENATRHTVTFNDGTNTISYYVVGKLGNDAPATPTIPTGYTSFDGWCTAQTGGTKFDFTTAITSDITLYARFTPNTYTVSYNAGANGTGTIAAGSKTHGVDFTLGSNTFTRTGYTQTGWATTDGGEKVYDLGGNYTDNVAETLYPVWTVNQYTITVKPENGERRNGY